MSRPIRVIVSDGDEDAAARIARILSESGDVEVVSARLERLTPRELEVLAMVADADTNAVIATRLAITTRAVERHVNSIFRKLEIPGDGSVNRRVRAALVYRSVPFRGSGITPGG